MSESNNSSSSNTNNPFLDLIENSTSKTTPSSSSELPSSSETVVKESVVQPSSVEETVTTETKSTSKLNILDTKINAIIEKVFRFTINKDVTSKSRLPLVYMEEIAPLSENGLFKFDILEQALFERLLLLNPQDYILPKNHAIDSDNDYVIETKVINYLYRAYEICEELRNNKNDDIITTELCLQINSLIMRNICTSIKQPELYYGQSLSLQWLDILKNNQNDENFRRNFLISVVKELLQQNDNDELITMGNLKSIFYPMFTEILKLLRDSNLINLSTWIIEIILLFISDKNTPQLGKLIIDFTTPNPDTKGKEYSETLFGQLLSLSILPKYQNGPYEFYTTPSDALSGNLNESLWSTLQKHLDNLHIIFKKLLTLNDDIKIQTLQWIGNCLNVNVSRGQIWNTHNLMTTMIDVTNSSDAFMINLCGVLLRLCKPLFRPNLKVLLVDPTYCAVPEDERLIKNVHLKNVIKETCLIPTEDGEKRLTANSYNFITECFFMTHKAIDLSKCNFKL